MCIRNEAGSVSACPVFSLLGQAGSDGALPLAIVLGHAYQITSATEPARRLPGCRCVLRRALYAD